MPTNYNDCKYTAFISYSSADSDLYDGGWARIFDAEFKKKLNAKLSRLQGGAKKNYIYETAPITSGDLTEELGKKISDSFAMVILVGDNYLESEICLKECKSFSKNIEKEKLQRRLFIIALTKSTTEILNKDWSALIDIGYTPAFIPFYSDNEEDRPLRLHSTTQAGEAVRNNKYEQKMDVFVDGVASVVNENVKSSLQSPPFHKPSPTNSKKVLIGVTTEELVEQSKNLKMLLAQNNFDVTSFSMKKLGRYTKPEDLSEEYEKYAYLILPYSQCIPCMRIYGAGGHLKFQQDAWVSDNKILWLSNKETEILDDELSTGEDKEYISKIESSSNSYSSKIELLEELQKLTSNNTPEESDKVFRLYIEKNNNEDTEWRFLGKCINKIWHEINQDQASIPKLIVQTFDIDQINSEDFKDEIKSVNSIIIIWGKKEKNAINEQITKLDKLFIEVDFPSKRDYSLHPCFIAFLSPPNKLDDVLNAYHGWDLYKFIKGPNNNFDLEASENEKLKKLLKNFIEQYESF